MSEAAASFIDGRSLEDTLPHRWGRGDAAVLSSELFSTQSSSYCVSGEKEDFSREGKKSLLLICRQWKDPAAIFKNRFERRKKKNLLLR